MQNIPLVRRAGTGAALSNLILVAMAASLGVVLATGHAAFTTAGVTLAALGVLVTLVVIAFARRQLRADPNRGMFARLAVGVALATLLMALASDALLLVAGWIATGRLMAGLVGHVSGWDQANNAARRATVAFTVGDLALVGAVTILALAAKSTDLATMTARAAQLDPALVALVALLLVLAAFARCAIPPFSGWLIASLAAPTPVSALMHAGFVNAGGFLLVRFAPVIEAAPTVRFVLFAAGIAAALMGSAMALVRSDVKGSLAASTVAQMGFMLATIALGAYAAALWHMVAHGLFKAWLFLGSAGTITTARSRAEGLAQPQPALIALVVLGAMGMALSSEFANALLPIGLALAALLVALAISARSLARSRFGLAVAATVLALVAINIAALGALSNLQPDAATPLIAPLAQFALLSIFLAAWVWQQGLGAGERTLPPRLVARLMHIGTPIPVNHGSKD